MPTADLPKHAPSLSDEPIDIAALHERTMRRYPKAMACLAEFERREAKDELARKKKPGD